MMMRIMPENSTYFLFRLNKHDMYTTECNKVKENLSISTIPII